MFYQKIKNMAFTDCRFFGRVIDGGMNNASSSQEGVKFKKCLFSDCHSSLSVFTEEKDFIFSGTGFSFLSLDSCTFNLYKTRVWNLSPLKGVSSIVQNTNINEYRFSFPAPDANLVATDNDMIILNNNFNLRTGNTYTHYVNFVLGTLPASNNVSFSNQVKFCAVPITADDKNPYDNTVTGMTPSMNKKYSIFPNPSLGGQFKVYNNSEESLNCTFYDIRGRQISQA